MEFVDDRPMCELMVSRRAQGLSSRMINCVLPLIEAHRSLGEQYKIFTTSWIEEEGRLTDIFKLALDAKIRLLLTPDLYECVFPLPGTELNDTSMRVGLDHAIHHSNPGSHAVVGVTVFLALFKYAAAQESFTYNRFLPNAKVTKGVHPEVWMRARVLT